MSAPEQRDEQFARDLRGDHDSPWSYGPWGLTDLRTFAERDAEDWPDETRENR